MDTRGSWEKHPPSKTLKSTQLITARDKTPDVSRACYMTRWGELESSGASGWPTTSGNCCHSWTHCQIRFSIRFLNSPIFKVWHLVTYWVAQIKQVWYTWSGRNL